MLRIFSRKSRAFLIALLVLGGLFYDTRWFGLRNRPALLVDLTIAAAAEPTLDLPQTEAVTVTSNSSTSTSKSQQKSPVIDIISIGSLHRPDYQMAQKTTFGKHRSVRQFWSITEEDDVDPDCSTRLQWRDVQNISGFCGGLRRDIQDKHRLLYELKGKFAKPQWLERTKANPAAWLCAQKRPMAGFGKALASYTTSSRLPDYVLILDDDTYYDMEQVVSGLVSLQQEQYRLYGDDSMVVAGCAIRSRLKHFKWTFPFGGWGTIFSRGALEALLQPLYCGNRTDSHYDSASAKFCPKLWKDRIGEYQVYQEGMSLFDIMYRYVTKEPYVDHANWSLGFCLHSDWVWGYMVNYYNISIAMGRRSKDLIVDRLGAYNGSEINPPYSEGVLKLRRQCDFDSDRNCTKEAHMCHYVTPQHMHYLSSQQQQQG